MPESFDLQGNFVHTGLTQRVIGERVTFQFSVPPEKLLQKIEYVFDGDAYFIEAHNVSNNSASYTPGRRIRNESLFNLWFTTTGTVIVSVKAEVLDYLQSKVIEVNGSFSFNVIAPTFTVNKLNFGEFKMKVDDKNMWTLTYGAENAGDQPGIDIDVTVTAPRDPSVDKFAQGYFCWVQVLTYYTRLAYKDATQDNRLRNLEITGSKDVAGLDNQIPYDNHQIQGDAGIPVKINFNDSPNFQFPMNYRISSDTITKVDHFEHNFQATAYLMYRANNPDAPDAAIWVTIGKISWLANAIGNRTEGTYDFYSNDGEYNQKQTLQPCNDLPTWTTFYKND